MVMVDSEMDSVPCRDHAECGGSAVHKDCAAFVLAVALKVLDVLDLPAALDLPDFRKLQETQKQIDVRLVSEYDLTL